MMENGPVATWDRYQPITFPCPYCGKDLRDSFYLHMYEAHGLDIPYARCLCGATGLDVYLMCHHWAASDRDHAIAVLMASDVGGSHSDY